MRKKIFILSAFVTLGTLPMAWAKTDRKSFSLEEAVQTALQRNPLSRAAQLQVQTAGYNLTRAKTLKYTPQMNMRIHSGLVPEARGDIFSSPDKQDDLDGLGPFYRLQFDVVQPLYTFGRTSAAIEASKQGIFLEEAKENLVHEQLSLESVRAYWGITAAQKAFELSQELRKKYDQLLSEVEERLADEDSEVDDADLLEVRAYDYNIHENYYTSVEVKTMATKTFNALLDLDLNLEVSTKEEPSPEFGLQENDVSRLLSLAERLRPDLRVLNTAIKTLEAKIELAKSKKFPLVFLVAGLGYANANNRTDQDNPFVWDNFNFKRVTATLGLSWDTNFFLHNIEVHKAQSEQRVVWEKLMAARSKMAIEVNQAYLEVKKYATLLKALDQSLDAAKSWLRVVSENWSLGLGEVRRMIRAYEAYYGLKNLAIERNYQYNIALAKLAHTLGKTALYLEWIKKGRVDVTAI